VKRRAFIRTAALSAASLAGVRLWPQASSSNAPALTKRPYKKGIELSIIGFPGLVLQGMEQDHVNELVAQAVERGVNYFDVAPAYDRGRCEMRLGPALEPHRKNVFLACKTQQRTAAGAKEEFERSLERLKTDHFDLYQLHSIYDVEKHVKAAFAKGGAMAYILEQQKAGRIRHLGFSAHSEAAALAALDLHAFDSFLLPINFACYLKAGFGPKVLAKASEVGATPISIKSCVRQKHQGNSDAIQQKYRRCWYQPIDNRREADLAVRWALDLPIMACLPPMDERLFWQAVDVAQQYKSLNETEQAEIRALAEGMDPLFPREG